ncbi:hypothetical protein DITRI_Ditri07aG0039100 [Diplodiscus trichospermus]
MSNFIGQIEEIKTLISSNSKTNKSFGYSTLLHFQEQSSDGSPSIQALVQSSQCLIALVVADIHDEDEDIAAQALKCLGFMIYHPSLVATIPAEDGKLVLGSLAKLIAVTKIKSVCNLGVWCISIQQFDAALLAACFDILLLAVIHALDNPIGSLSTTFEAMQAVAKLAAPLSEMMREYSHLWAPPIYRRLLSTDKRERDMSERCLLKIRSTIFPPPRCLSKAIIQDMKKKLLIVMKDQLDKGMKVQTVQAWGWFICFLGSDALKNRHLVNDMLKVPEQTFSDHNPQVQIASLVAWEGLIDALVLPQILACKKNATLENEVQQLQTSPGKSSETQLNGFSKSLKLIMTPLIGIISSKCDVSVHFSCLNTLCYLLHKLDTSINSQWVIKLVLDPMFEAVFKIGPGSKSIWLWNLCLDLLDDCISAKYSDLNSNKKDQVNLCLSASNFIPGPCTSGGYSWKQYPIKWLPWDLSLLDFFLKMIAVIISHVATATAAPESKKTARNAAVRIFRSVLKGIQMEFKNPLNNYDNIMFCLNIILKFMKQIGEDASSDGDLFSTSLRFIEAVAEESEPSILGSPLYKVALDIKCFGSLNSVDSKHSKILHQCSIAFMDMVSPMVYLTVLYISLAVQLFTINIPEKELSLHRFQSFLKFVLSSDYPLESFLASVGVLYRHMGFNYLEIWIAIVTGLNGYIDDMKDLSLFKTDSENSVYRAICYLLSYPFFLFSCSQKDLIPWKASESLRESFILSERKLEQAIEVWKSLYGSVSVACFKFSAMDTFGGDLCAMLNWCFDENGSIFQYKSELGLCYKDMEPACLSFSGKVVECILEQKLTSYTNSCQNERECVGVCNKSSGLNNILEFASRVMKFLYINIGTELLAVLAISRVFSLLARFISCLHLKQDILPFFEIISCPLLQWLSHLEIEDERAKDQLGILWAETLNCLQRSQPPITFDSSFLKLQACVLEKTLDHPNTSISDPTIIFWNSTYGKQINLVYPRNLLHVLDKLSRNGRINLYNRSKSLLVSCSTLESNHVTAPQSCKVTATQNRSSKRVELTEDMFGQFNQKGKPPSSSKRKRVELTEHQKEVRRAQQGRERDCSGHGPGIRTYTSLDFSQGNEESQESQDIRHSETMVEMLRKLG